VSIRSRTDTIGGHRQKGVTVYYHAFKYTDREGDEHIAETDGCGRDNWYHADVFEPTCPRSKARPLNQKPCWATGGLSDRLVA